MLIFALMISNKAKRIDYIFEDTKLTIYTQCMGKMVLFNRTDLFLDKCGELINVTFSKIKLNTCRLVNFSN